MAEHWYWCVDCKTPGCPERQPLKYIGNDIDWPEGPGGVVISFPVPFETRCGTCRSVHNYTLREDVRPRKLAGPPPPGFWNQF